MKKKVLIMLVMMMIFVSFSSFSYAETSGYQYHDDKYGYSVSFPNDWEQIDQSNIDDLFGFLKIDIIGFQEKGSLGFQTPYTLILANNKSSADYIFTKDTLNNYKVDPTTTRQKLKDYFYKKYQDQGYTDVNINNIEIDAVKNRIYIDVKLKLPDGTFVDEITAYILGENNIIALDSVIDHDNREEELLIINNIIDSFVFDEGNEYIEDDNKIISLYTSTGLSTQKSVRTYAISTKDGYIYGNVKFEKATTDEVIAKWYRIVDGQRQILGYDAQDAGKQSYTFTFAPLNKGQWELEVTSGDIKETITYNVYDTKVTRPINIYIDGIQKVYDVDAKVVNGSTLVPMRGIFEDLDAQISWDGNTKTVTAISGETTIKLTINSDYAYINGKQVKLTQKAQIIDGRTMVPLRFVSESLGATVNWDGTTNSIFILTK